MPLKNISKEPVQVRYNSIEKVIEPGKILDVRDFNIKAEFMLNVEMRIIEKYDPEKKKLKIIATKDLGAQIDELNVENKSLKEKVTFLEEEIKKLEDKLKAKR